MTETGALSRRLEEVWDWKTAIYSEVAALPTTEALASILRHGIDAEKKAADFLKTRKPEKMSA